MIDIDIFILGGHVEPLSRGIDSYRTGRMVIPMPATPGGILPTPVSTPHDSGTDDRPPGAPPSPPPELEMDSAAGQDQRSKDGKSSSGSTTRSAGTRTGERPSSIELPKPPIFSSVMAPSPEPFPTTIPTASPPTSSASDIQPGLQVLVVDDDSLTRMLMKRMLTRMGCAVSVAENGHVALEMIMGSHPTPQSEKTASIDGRAASSMRGQPREQKYAVVFLDNQMPVLSGLHAVSVS